MYLHERDRWTDFTWDDAAILPLVSRARFAQGKLLGSMQALGFNLDTEAFARVLQSEIISSSIVEGVALDLAKVRSSVARRLGTNDPAPHLSTHDVDGAVDVALDASLHYAEPVTGSRFCDWHAALFPTGRSGMRNIVVGEYRKTPMSVVSGPIGKERIHFQAPDAQEVPALMEGLIAWIEAPVYSDEKKMLEPLVAAGVAHLGFLTVHPFEDGNGRIARALLELMLCRGDGDHRRFYSLSSHILDHREEYYAALEQAQKGGRDITGWLVWFLNAVIGAICESESVLEGVVKRAGFWRGVDGSSLNERQRKVLTLLTDDFEGKLTAQKWAKLCKVSPDTALRDINALMKQGILRKSSAGGRSTAYEIVGF
ncbi:MAG: Fic family protein, partial [Eggerthellaceae bacterium]|nr:Fic family protein [Eggerthellaceae bacterium]